MKPEEKRRQRLEQAKRSVLGSGHGVIAKMPDETGPSAYDPITGTWLKIEGNILHGIMADVKLEASNIIIVMPFPTSKAAMEAFDGLVESARKGIEEKPWGGTGSDRDGHTYTSMWEEYHGQPVSDSDMVRANAEGILHPLIPQGVGAIIQGPVVRVWWEDADTPMLTILALGGRHEVDVPLRNVTEVTKKPKRGTFRSVPSTDSDLSYME